MMGFIPDELKKFIGEFIELNYELKVKIHLPTGKIVIMLTPLGKKIDTTEKK